MIKLVVQGEKVGAERKLIILGIDVDNVASLVDGKPILVVGDEIGFPALDIAIHYGPSLADIVDDLRAAGLPVPPNEELLFP